MQIYKDLSEDVKKTVATTVFGLEHGRQLARLKDVSGKQLELAEEFAEAERPMTDCCDGLGYD